MGQTVYVLMSLEGGKKDREWRPIAVVTDATVAEQWGQAGKQVDWVPLELDDIRYIQPTDEYKKQPSPEFKPGKMTPIEQRAVEAAQKLEETNRRLLAIIERLQKQLGIRGKVPGMQELKQQQVPAEPKKSAKETVPPKPAGFADVLNDSQEIADYVETYATDYVDNELVDEKYRGTYAVLKLVPIDQLKEAGRSHNMQVPANEKKYQRMSIKTIPPLLVENGEVVDGNHRLRAAIKRGLTAMWCYVVMEGKAPSLFDEEEQ